MNKIFLSHSSSDKDRYVRIIADKFGKDRCIYDEYTFGPGMKTLEEIYSGIDKTDVFVFFISDESLESKWVKKEITEATQKTIKGKAVFLPIIIDPRIQYNDSRIPKFLKNSYNLQYISKPTIAYKIILQKLREIIWIKHPVIDERENLFVGRHELQSKIEERLDDLENPNLITIFAMGMNGIGRRSLLINSIIKANIKEKYYRPSEITLERGEGVEDYIVKIYSLGIANNHDLNFLLERSMDEKIELAIKITSEIVDCNEIIFIEDNNSIISYLDDSICISDWFVKLIENLRSKNKLCLCLRSALRISYAPNNIKDVSLLLNVSELNRSERIGLLNRYANIRELEIEKSDLAFFQDILSGFPEQIFYTVELIKERGIERAKKETHLIVDYNSQKIINILNRYPKESKDLEIIAFISKFDFISFDFLFSILKEQKIETDVINTLIEHSICEVFGKNQDFLRINDTIKDYILRQNTPISRENEKILAQQIKIILGNDNLFELDSSEIFISIRESLISGDDIDRRYLIPSHFIKTVAEFYHRKKKYNEVVRLVDMVLERSSNNLDPKIIRELQYYLCLSLARLSDTRFLEVVKNIQGADNKFLMGFYYRQKGSYRMALDLLMEATTMRKNFNMAKRELVQVYIRLEDFASGLLIARENYNSYKNNPYNIQGYFSCLIRMPHGKENEKILKELLDNLSIIKTDVAEEMLLVLKAQFESIYNRNNILAMDFVNEAIRRFPQSNYPYLMLFDVSEKYSDILSMEKAINKLNDNINKKSHLYKSLITRRAVFEAHRGNKELAIRIINTELDDMPKDYIERFKTVIQSIR
jgi:hypothetical protein